MSLTYEVETRCIDLDGFPYIRSMWYLRHDDPHRINAPAYLGEDGSYEYAEYGDPHRINAPAVYIYSTMREKYYIRGKVISHRQIDRTY